MTSFLKNDSWKGEWFLEDFSRKNSQISNKNKKRKMSQPTQKNTLLNNKVKNDYLFPI